MIEAILCHINLFWSDRQLLCRLANNTCSSPKRLMSALSSFTLIRSAIIVFLSGFETKVTACDGGADALGTSGR